MYNRAKSVFSLRHTQMKLKAASALTVPILAFAGTILSAGAAHADLPSGENVIGGSFSGFDRSVADNLTITQTSDRGLIEWQNFSIGAGKTTTFAQPGSNSITVNRVVGADPTAILGNLNANGKIMILDQNGVMFGAGATINVGGIVASTGDLANQDAFLDGTDNGKIGLTGLTDKSVKNNANFTTSGFVSFIAKDVVNTGNIQADNINFAAGNVDAVVDFNGDGLVTFAVASQTAETLLNNTGNLTATGGHIALTAAAKDGIVNNTINMDGIAVAKSVTVDGGVITLGGSVTTTGGNVEIASNGRNNDHQVTLKNGSTITANGGDVTIDAGGSRRADTFMGGTINMNNGSQINATQVAGNGGNVTLDGYHNNLGGNAKITAKKLEVKGSNLGQGGGSIIEAEVLKANTISAAHFRGVNNQIGRVEELNTGITGEAGGITLVNKGKITLAGDVTSNGGNIDIKTSGTMWNEGLDILAASNVTSNGGNISIDTANGSIYQVGNIDTTGVSSKGDVSVKGLEFALTGNSRIIGKDLTINTQMVLQADTSAIDVTNLKGQTLKFAHFDGAGNLISNLGNFNTGMYGWDEGSFRLVNAKTLNVAGNLVTNGGDIDVLVNGGELNVNAGKAIRSKGGDISLKTTNGVQRIRVSGEIDASGEGSALGDVSLHSAWTMLLQGNHNIVANNLDLKTDANSITQSGGGKVKANTLTGSAHDQLELINANNEITTIGNFATGTGVNKIGGFTLNEKDGVLVTGTISTKGGDVNITTAGVDHTQTTRVNGQIVSNGGNININANGGFVQNYGVIDARKTGGATGDVFLNGSQLQLTGSKIYADDLSLTGGTTTQNVNGVIEANTLTGNSLTTVALLGANNKINNLGTYSTGGGNWHKGSFELVNSTNLNVIGEIITNSDNAGNSGTANIDLKAAGNINIAAGGSLDANGGNVNVEQTGTFTGVANSVKTSGAGTIDLQQNVGGSINNAIAAIANTGTGLNSILVGDGAYNENIVINKSNLTLSSSTGRGNTFINGVANAGANATITITENTQNVTLGGHNSGFKITGFDNGQAHMENAAIDLYGKGLSDITIDGNEIVANGDLALLTTWSDGVAAVDGLIINNNIFSGKTYTGTSWATGDQFSVANVARALVYINLGATDVQFTNNTLSGDAGGATLLGVDGSDVTITGNTFTGKTDSYAIQALLGSDIEISGNTFDSTNYHPNGGYIITGASALQSPQDMGWIFANNTFIGNTVWANAYTTDGIIHTSIQPVINAAAVNATVTASAGTFTEQVVIDKDLTLQGAGAGQTIIKSPDALAVSYDNRKAVVLAKNSDNIVIDGVTVDGANKGNANYVFMGVVYLNAGGELRNSHITGFTDASFSGTQGGNAVLATVTDGHARTVRITDNLVDDFQKNGITVLGAGLTAYVVGNDVIGYGATNIIAQNGIQLGDGALGYIYDNDVSGIGYTLPSWAATSIMAYDAGEGSEIKNNRVVGTGHDYGLYAYMGKGLLVEGNSFDNSISGILAYNTEDIRILNNTVTNSDIAIDAYGAFGNNVISGNILSGSNNGADIGISLENTAGSWDVHNNSAQSLEYGIYARNASGDVVLHDNTVSDAAVAIAVTDSDDVVIRRNTLIGENGIELINTDNTQVLANTIIATDTGINVDSSTGSVIAGNTIIAAKVGVDLSNADVATVRDNNISGVQVGVGANGGSGLNVTGNTINGLTAVELQGVTNARVIDNSLNGATGVKVGSAANGVKIAQNSILGVNKGIDVNTANNLTIDANTINGITAVELQNVTGADITENVVRGATGIKVGGASTDVTVLNNNLADAGFILFGMPVSYAIDNSASAIVDARGNWFGSNNQNTVANNNRGNVDYSVYLAAGTDSSAAKGFQGDFSHLFVTTRGGSVAGKRIQSAVDLLADGARTGGNRIIDVLGGVYNEDSIAVNKSVQLRGVAGQTIVDGVTGGQNGLRVTANDVSVTGMTLRNFNTALALHNADRFVIKNNTVQGATFGIFADGTTATTGLIENNNVSDVTRHAIHTRGGQYADILNNVIRNSDFGITVENYQVLRPDGLVTRVDGNDIEALSFGIRTNLSSLSAKDQSGFVVSNNNIRAINDTLANRWTGINVLAEDAGVATTFLNNIIDGSALSNRQSAGYEVSLVRSANRPVIDGGSISHVGAGVWVTDGSQYSNANTLGRVNDVLVTNVAFDNISEAAIYVEDTTNHTSSTKVTIGTGNVFGANVTYDLALAGYGAQVALDTGFDGVGKTLVKAAGLGRYGANGYVTDSANIQTGVNSTAAGGKVDIEEGTFKGNIVVDKALNITGAGSDKTIVEGNGTGTGFTLAGSGINLKALEVTNFVDGLLVDTSINALNLDDVSASGNVHAGMHVTMDGSIDGLTVNDSRFDNNGTTNDVESQGFGWAFWKNAVLNAADTVKNVFVSDTTFNGNARKGVYAEKLSDATFNTITVENSGADTNYLYPTAGLELNLKTGVYSNIHFDGITIRNSAANTEFNGSFYKHNSSAAFSVKARNDGSYASAPASLTNVTFNNVDIDAIGNTALAVGNNVSGVTITDVNITNAAQGVVVYGGVNDLTITKANIDVTRNGYEGINVGATPGAGVVIANSNNISVEDVHITNVMGHGFVVNNSNTVTLTDNSVTGAESGVVANNSNNLTVFDNELNDVEIGVYVNGGTAVSVTENIVTASDVGFELIDTVNSTVAENTVSNSNPANNNDVHGVTVNGGSNALVNNNTFNNLVMGVEVFGGTGHTVSNHINFNNVDTGISVTNTTGAFVQNNTVAANNNGIILAGTATGTLVDNNRVNNAGIGFLTQGADVGTVNLFRNVFTGNGTAVRLESGIVDFGATVAQANIINGGAGMVGLQLAPTVTSDLVLARDSLGHTFFSGFTGHAPNSGTFYARLEDNAYFLDGVSYRIDALDVTFDGINANKSSFMPGVLTATELQQIEALIWDADDAAGRGNIFAGFVPNADQDEDGNEGQDNMSGTGFSVTILGLPSIPGGTSAGFASAAAFNAITPFAGGTDAASLNAITPAAGGNSVGGVRVPAPSAGASAADLNNIDPAAGGNATNCWSDFAMGAGVSAVSYSASGSMVDVMNAEAGCGI